MNSCLCPSQRSNTIYRSFRARAPAVCTNQSLACHPARSCSLTHTPPIQQFSTLSKPAASINWFIHPKTNHTSQYTMHFLAAILSGLTLASVAAAFPSALAKVGHLTYGDVELDVNNGCQAVPQNKPNAVLPNPSYFTRLEVNSGYTCELYQ